MNRTLTAVAIYALAMTVANLSVVGAIGRWGPTAIPYITSINAFALIGLDLALRDWLHMRLKPAHMLGLILAAGALTYALNPDAGRIAVASACAFTAAALVDWGIFARASGTWLKRANASNIAGAAVDSLVFPTLAFGALLPGVVLGQFLAKVLGGAMWAALLNKAFARSNADA